MTGASGVARKWGARAVRSGSPWQLLNGRSRELDVQVTLPDGMLDLVMTMAGRRVR